jgi:hypothetical protein
MLDCVPIAQPLARRRDGGLVRSTSDSSAGAPRRIDAEPRSYIALDLSHLLSGGIVECETDCAVRLAYVEVGSIDLGPRPSSMRRRRRPRSEDRSTRDPDPDRRRELIAELWTEGGAHILPPLQEIREITARRSPQRTAQWKASGSSSCSSARTATSGATTSSSRVEHGQAGRRRGFQDGVLPWLHRVIAR